MKIINAELFKHVQNLMSISIITVIHLPMMNIKNNIGPRIHPCGTPGSTASYFRYVKSLMSYQGKEANEIVLRYSKVLTGKETEPPRYLSIYRSIYGLSIYLSI